MASETTPLLGPPAAPAASAAAPGPVLRNFSQRRILGVEESKGGERGDEAPVGAGAGAGAAAAAIELTEEECYARPKNDTIETWFTTNNPDPRLVPYKESISTLYETVVCLKGREPNFVINDTFTLEVMRDIFKDIEKLNIFNIIKKKFTGYTPDQTAILVGLFAKLFNQQHNAPSWPPENYPEDKMPSLYSIKGFQQESFLDATIRQLAAIKVEGKSNIKEVYDYIVGLKETNPAQLLEIVQRFCKSEWDKFNTLMPDNRTIYFNRDPSAVRLIGNLLPQWYDYVYRSLDSSYFTELEFTPYRGQVHHTHTFKRKSINKEQQIFFILPNNINPITYKILDVDVQREYMATMGALNKPNINIEDKDSIFWPNVTNFQWIQVDDTLGLPLKEREIYQYQGYRLTYFPHPEVLLAIAHGVKDMSPHMRSLFPEWATKETRQRWVRDALETWNRDIEAMSDPDQKYVQRYLYNDVKPKIDATFTVVETLPRIDANIKRLAANANTMDPNAMFGRVQNFQQSYSSVLAPLKSAGTITELQVRNKGRRWYGAAIESKEAYRAKIKSYIAQIQRALGGPSAVSTEVDMILKLARAPKPNTRDLYARFDAWRRTLDYSKLPVDLANRIREVRPAGFFTGAAGYAAKIAELVLATQQTGPQVVAGAVLDTTLTTISGKVREFDSAMDTVTDMLPHDEQAAEIARIIHDIPSYTKGSMDPRAYLVRVFEGLKQAYDIFGEWRAGSSRHDAGAAAHVGGWRRTAKTGAKSKGMTRRCKHTRKAQRLPKGGCYDAPHAAQHGGASMPLAYYQDGAQMRGTYADPTGVGLAGSTATMARTGISQTGGRRCQNGGKQSGCRQNGGFAPSIMGQMVVNSAYLTPVASYMGYRLIKNERKGSRSSRKGPRSAYHSGNRFTSRGPRSTQKKRRATHRR